MKTTLKRSSSKRTYAGERKSQETSIIVNSVKNRAIPQITAGCSNIVSAMKRPPDIGLEIA